MNREEIDKWLDEEYGCSYTRLEELHDYYFEKYTDQKEEIQRLNNIIEELEKDLRKEIERTEELILEDGELVEINNIRKMINDERKLILLKINKLKSIERR